MKSDMHSCIIIFRPDLKNNNSETLSKITFRELYGSGVERTTLVTKTFTTPSNRKLDLQTVNSNYHIELAPGYGFFLFFFNFLILFFCNVNILTF